MWIFPRIPSLVRGLLLQEVSLTHPALSILCYLYHPHIHSKMDMSPSHAHLLPSSCRKPARPGPCCPVPEAHLPSAGTRCRPWRPSGARWGLRAAASHTPVAATQRRPTAEERAGNAITHSPRLQLTGHLLHSGGVPKLPVLALHPFPPKGQEEGPVGAQAVWAGKSLLGLRCLIWRMEAVTLAQSEMTAAKVTTGGSSLKGIQM